MDNQTKTLKEAMVSQGVCITKLEEVVTKGQDDTNKKFEMMKVRVDEVRRVGEKNMANLEERLRQLEVGERPVALADAGGGTGRAEAPEAAAQVWRRPRHMIFGG